MGDRHPSAAAGASDLVGAKPRAFGRPFSGKYGSQWTQAADGKRFPSKAEAKRYEELSRLQAIGEITELTTHPAWTFEIDGQSLKWESRAIRYTADFSYKDKAGRLVVEDVKGVMTRDVHIRLALMRACHGIDVRLVRYRPRRSSRQRIKDRARRL